MFSVLKKRKPCQEEALALYAAAMRAAREPVFYESLSVPDTMDGRFDLLMIHVFLILNRILEGREEPDDLAQAIFDTAFADFDQALRESGVGDMGITKHMKRMMLAFNGRMHRYSAALEQGQAALEAALRSNLYGTLETVHDPVLRRMARYIQENAAYLSSRPVEEIRGGNVYFIPIEAKEASTHGQTQN